MTTDVTLEEYYAELKMMFQSTGWDLLCDELLNNVQVINNLQSVQDQRDLDYKRGQLAAIGVILNFPDTIQRAELEENQESLSESTE